jgi:hypothetical protein
MWHFLLFLLKNHWEHAGSLQLIWHAVAEALALMAPWGTAL